MNEPARTVTPRGFTGYDEFTDTYGSRIRIQESSSAEGPRVWVFAEHPTQDMWLSNRDRNALRGFDLGELASKLTPSPHLDMEQATRLRDALDAFIKEHSGRDDRS